MKLLFQISSGRRIRSTILGLFRLDFWNFFLLNRETVHFSRTRYPLLHWIVDKSVVYVMQQESDKFLLFLRRHLFRWPFATHIASFWEQLEIHLQWYSMIRKTCIGSKLSRSSSVLLNHPRFQSMKIGWTSFSYFSLRKDHDCFIKLN